MLFLHIKSVFVDSRGIIQLFVHAGRQVQIQPVTTHFIGTVDGISDLLVIPVQHGLCKHRQFSDRLPVFPDCDRVSHIQKLKIGIIFHASHPARYSQKHTFPGAHFLVKCVRIGLPLFDGHAGNGGFFHAIDITHGASVFSQDKTEQILVEGPCKAVFVISLRVFPLHSEIIRDIDILQGILIYGCPVPDTGLCGDIRDRTVRHCHVTGGKSFHIVHGIRMQDRKICPYHLVDLLADIHTGCDRPHAVEQYHTQSQ